MHVRATYVSLIHRKRPIPFSRYWFYRTHDSFTIAVMWHIVAQRCFLHIVKSFIFWYRSNRILFREYETEN